MKKIIGIIAGVLMIAVLSVPMMVMAEGPLDSPLYTPASPIAFNNDFDLANNTSYGAGTVADPYVLANVSINGTGAGFCIYVGNTTANFSIKNSYLHNATVVGGIGEPYTWPYDCGANVIIYKSNRVNITNCSLWLPEYHGVYVDNSENVSIYDNTFNSCPWWSISVKNTSTSIDIVDNEIVGATGGSDYGGIGFFNQCSDILVDTNYITLVTNDMRLNITSNCRLYNNFFNSGIGGVWLDNTDDMDILLNSYWGASAGMSISDSNNVTVEQCIFNLNPVHCLSFVNTTNSSAGNNTMESTITNLYNDVGLYISTGSNNNTFYGNYITGCNTTGIYVYSQTTVNNTFWGNVLINNLGDNADDGGNWNSWDNGSYGNSWDDYTGVDADRDGIGDTPYVIDAESSDNYPLVAIPALPVVDPSDGGGSTSYDWTITVTYLKDGLATAISGATITHHGVVVGTTNENGIYVLTGITTGEHILTIAADGYETATITHEFVASDYSSSVTLTPTDDGQSGLFCGTSGVIGAVIISACLVGGATGATKFFNIGKGGNE